MANALVWIDCEMTGLDVDNDVLVEIAVQVTDGELNLLGEGLDVVIATDPAKLDEMGDFVREMHTSSGLLDEIKASKVTLAEAEQMALAYIKQHVPVAGKAPIAGNTISTDRTFLARYMPELESYLHYRSVDVSSIKELAKRWYPKAFNAAPIKHGNHRALADIMDSIRELMYYRAAVFVPTPGPTSDKARQVADSLSA